MISTNKKILVKTRGNYETRTLYKEKGKNYARIGGSYIRITRLYLSGAGVYYRPYRTSDKVITYKTVNGVKRFMESNKYKEVKTHAKTKYKN